jgi:hypothetical protein
MTTNHTLDNKWTLWYHDPDDKRWTLDSYNRLAQLTTLEQFLTYYDAIESVTSGMFFLMKEDIPPIWEDSCNVKGGIITYKLLKNISDKIWDELSMMLVGGTIAEDYTYINGISISPKINNCIIKIWVKEASKMNSIVFNKESDFFKNYQPIHKVFG